MNFINKQNCAVIFFDLPHDGFQALFKISPIAGPGQKRTHIQTKNGGILQYLRHILFHNPPGQPLGNSGFAHPRIPHIKRVILGAPAQNLDRPVDFIFPTDQRVNPPLPGLVVKVDTIFVQGRISLFFRFLNLFLTVRRSGITIGSRFGQPVRNIANRIQAGHVMLLQKIDRVAFPFGKQANQHIGACDLFPARTLHMQNGALDNALETGRRRSFHPSVGFDVLQLYIQISFDFGAELGNIHVTGAQHSHRILIIQKSQQQMLQRGKFMLSFIGLTNSAVKSMFKIR